MVMKIHKDIKVEGKVQGVWFRDSTMKKARSLGLSGTVKNLLDGSVAVEVEGEDNKKIEELISWLHKGPEKAEVTRVHVEEGKWKGIMGFDVIYD